MRGRRVSRRCPATALEAHVVALVVAVLVRIAFQMALFFSETARELVQRILSRLGEREEEAGGTAGAGVGVARDLWDEKLPKYLLLLAALATAVTYQAAMSPPGGLLGAGMPGHNAGDPVLASGYPRQSKAFFYCNAISFMASLVITVLLLIKRVSGTRPALLALHATIILDLFGLMGAYILALVVGVSACIAVLVHWQGG